MALDLFAVMSVSDYEAAKPWYELLFGGEAAFVAHETECVWELAEHCHVAVNQDPERAGGSMATVFTDDLDGTVAAISSRGLEPANLETYSNGVRKVSYRDADGNEIGFAGAPVET